MEVEATRDLTKFIVHVDMDAFVSPFDWSMHVLIRGPIQYASVEVLQNPSLKGKAFGVGQGVLTTASVGLHTASRWLLSGSV